MPSKSQTFTLSSILVRPQQMPLPIWLSSAGEANQAGQRHVVEAPGTAPGSEKLIPPAVYRHSRTSRQAEYRKAERQKKGLRATWR